MDTKGTVTVETAIIFPAIMAAVLFGYACITLCVNYFLVGICFNKTAQQLSDYAYIYHEKVISDISSDVRSSIKSEIGGKIDELLLNIPGFINDAIDIKGHVEKYEDDFLDKAEDQIYISMAYALFNINRLTGDNDFNIRDIDFSSSEFFRKNNEIILNMKCNIKFSLVFFNNNGVDMTYRIRTNAWLNGIGKKEKEEASEDVWELSNFERGRKIRQMFGANLPDNFPVIAAYENGRAIMIKSLDYRKESYQKENAVSKAVENMIKNLYNFRGQEKPFGKDEIVIKETDIKQRELILVIPDDMQDEFIKRGLEKAKNIAGSYGIILTVKRI